MSFRCSIFGFVPATWTVIAQRFVASQKHLFPSVRSICLLFIFAFKNETFTISFSRIRCFIHGAPFWCLLVSDLQFASFFIIKRHNIVRFWQIHTDLLFKMSYILHLNIVSFALVRRFGSIHPLPFTLQNVIFGIDEPTANVLVLHLPLM